MPTTSDDRPSILYALQYHPDTKTQAMELARLIADLEPGPQTRMGFMFCPRRDCVVDAEAEARVRSKFPDTRIYQCRNPASNWPAGPNAMMHEIYLMFCQHCNSGHPDRWNYAAIMLGEPDCVPLGRDWIERIWNEWHTCDWNWPQGNRQLVLGHWLTRHDSSHGTVHINGNMLISPEFIRRYPAFTQTRVGAWDTTHCRALMAYGRPSKTIYSDYNLGGTDPAKPWRGCEDLFKARTLFGPLPINREITHPAYLHGIKTPQGIGCVRSALGVEPPKNLRLPEK